MRTALSVLAASLLAGCAEGEIIGASDSISPWGDSAIRADTGVVTRADVQPDALVLHAEDAGVVRDAGDVGAVIVVDASNPSACTPASCAMGAMCDAATARCVCGPGFTGDGTACTPTAPDDPQTRSPATMCERWLSDRTTTATQVVVPGGSMCDPGQVDPAALADGMRLLNLYRWLSGLTPTRSEPSFAASEQSCALMEGVNGGLNHFPPSTWRCYAAVGATAAGQSNLASGSSMSPFLSVDLYVRESGNDLGHRRWCLDPALDATWFGASASASCMRAFPGGGDGSHPAWVAFPNPGPAPIENFGVWSVQSEVLSLSGSSTTVEVRDASTNTVLPIRMQSVGFGYAGDAIAWTPDGWTPTNGATYAVSIGGLPRGMHIQFTTTPTHCS